MRIITQLIIASLLLIGSESNAMQKYHLEGTIGDSHIYMHLEYYPDQADNTVWGRYFYKSSLKDIVLTNGTVDASTFNLTVESGYGNITETFILERTGDSFNGTWINSNGKELPVKLAKIDVNAIINPHKDIAYINDLKDEDAYTYAKSSYVKLVRGETSAKNGKSIINFEESHCHAPFFRLGNGFTRDQLEKVNPVLDEIHFKNILDQLECSPRWAYSDGNGIEYTTTINYLDDNLIGFEVFASWFCGGAHPDFGGKGYLIGLNNGVQYDITQLYDIDNTTLYKLMMSEYQFEKPTDENDYCDYTKSEYWYTDRWSVTDKGIAFTPYFFRAARSCEESFLLPFSTLEEYRDTSFPYKLGYE